MNNHGWTVLHQAADWGNIEVLAVLLDRGAAIDATADGGWTALHRAAAGGYIRVVKVLLDYGANTDRRNADGETALDVARARRRGTECMVALLTGKVHNRFYFTTSSGRIIFW